MRHTSFRALILLFALHISFASATTNQTPSVLKVGNAEKADNLNFTQHSGTWNIVLQGDINETLVRFNRASNQARPAHAKRWDYHKEENAYTFYLREDLVWSDGTAILAKDYVRSWQYLNDPKSRSNCYSFLKYVKNGLEIKKGLKSKDQLGVQAIDKHTLKVRLTSHPSYFLVLLASSHCYPIPFHQLSQEALKRPWVKASTLASGPYMLERDIDGSSVIYLKKNPKYWNRDNIYFDRMHWISYLGDENHLAKDLLNGNIHIAYNMTGNENTEWIAKHYSLWRNDSKAGALEYLSFSPSSSKTSLVASREIREALSMSIDRSALIAHRYVHKILSKAHTLAPKEYYTEAIPKPRWGSWSISKRRETAKRTLNSMGFSDESPLRITFHVNKEKGNYKVAMSIASMWRTIGVETEVISNPLSQHYRLINRGDFEVARLGWVDKTGAPDYFLNLLSPVPPYSSRSLSNRKIQSALETLNGLHDHEKRQQQQLEIERLVQESTLFIPIHHQRKINFISPKVSGYTGEMWGLRDIENIRWTED